MVADFKSHILRRDEKGIFGVPFKRWLLAGVAGGLTHTLARLFAPDVALPLGAGLGGLALVLTGTRGGLPLWQRGLYHVRGSLLLASVSQRGVYGRLAAALHLPMGLVTLESATVFAPAQPLSDREVDLREWATFARAVEVDTDDGLVFVAAPMTEGLPA